jgi:hypothetical protein
MAHLKTLASITRSRRTDPSRGSGSRGIMRPAYTKFKAPTSAVHELRRIMAPGPWIGSARQRHRPRDESMTKPTVPRIDVDEVAGDGLPDQSNAVASRGGGPGRGEALADGTRQDKRDTWSDFTPRISFAWSRQGPGWVRPEARSLGPGAWNLEPGTWSLEPGAWSLMNYPCSATPRVMLL